MAFSIGIKEGSFYERNPSLDKALDIAHSDEIISQQMVSMETDGGPTKEEIKKGKGKVFRRQSSGKDKKGKKKEETPKKKKHSGSEKCKFCGKQQRHTKRKDYLAYN